MEILLDTHILLWNLADDPRSKKAKSKIIEDPRNKVFFSIISLWEIAIKKGLALHHRDPFDRLLLAQAMIENLVIMTNDAYYKNYKIKII